MRRISEDYPPSPRCASAATPVMFYLFGYVHFFRFYGRRRITLLRRHSYPWIKWQTLPKCGRHSGEKGLQSFLKSLSPPRFFSLRSIDEISVVSDKRPLARAKATPYDATMSFAPRPTPSQYSSTSFNIPPNSSALF